MAKAINGFWMKFIDEPRGVRILKSGHKVKEGSVEEVDIVCKPSFEPPT